MRKRIINVIILILILCIGICIGKLLNWGYFELSKEIKIIEAISIFTTIGVAIYITRIIENEVQESRIEKNLFITKITELESLLKIIEDTIDEKDVSYRKINSRIHSFRLIKKSIFESINGNFKQVASEKIAGIEGRISYSTTLLKRLLTETPIDNKEKEPEITLVSGVVNYSISRILAINIETNSLRENLFMLKVRINHI
jgi:hypothetical protein